METFQNSELSGTCQSLSVAPHINYAGINWESFMDDPAAAAALFQSGNKPEVSRRWSGYYNAGQAGEVHHRSSGLW